eukprot:scaffold2913_cov181-Ochromonas_danica.AAC.54
MSLFSTPKRPMSSNGVNPLMDFSPNLSPISMFDGSSILPAGSHPHFLLPSTPDGPSQVLPQLQGQGPPQGRLPPSASKSSSLPPPPPLPGIIEESDSNGSSYFDRVKRGGGGEGDFDGEVSAMRFSPQRRLPLNTSNRVITGGHSADQQQKGHYNNNNSNNNNNQSDFMTSLSYLPHVSRDVSHVGEMKRSEDCPPTTSGDDGEEVQHSESNPARARPSSEAANAHHSPSDGDTIPLEIKRQYSREANRILLQSVQRTYRRWCDRQAERKINDVSNGLSSPPLTHPTVTFVSPSVQTPASSAPTPIPATATATASSSSSASASLPVGSLYALILDNNSNPLLVPVQSANHSNSQGTTKTSETPSSSSAKSEQPFHSSTLPPEDRRHMQSSHFHVPKEKSSYNMSGPETTAKRSVSPDLSFLRHSSTRRSFVQLEAQMQRRLLHSTRYGTPPPHHHEDSAFEQACQSFYTPQRITSWSSHRMNRHRLLATSLPTSFKKEDEDDHELSHATATKSFVLPSPLTQSDPSFPQGRGSEFWKERLNRRSIRSFLTDSDRLVES